MFKTQFLYNALVRHTATRNIGLHDIARAHLRWFDHPDFDPSIPVLWDCRAHFLNTSLGDLSDIHEHTLNHTERRRTPGARSAILVSNNVTKKALEETILQNPKIIAELQIFDDEASALAWLSVHTKEIL